MCALKVGKETLQSIKEDDKKDNLLSLISSIQSLVERNDTEKILEKLQNINDINTEKLIQAILETYKNNKSLEGLQESINKLANSISEKPTEFVFEISRDRGLIDKVIVKPSRSSN